VRLSRGWLHGADDVFIRNRQLIRRDSQVVTIHIDL
jgi:hypothetical protein